MMPIRTDCYLAVLKRFRARYPNAHFEIITRASGSILAPTTEILIATGYFTNPDGTKNPKNHDLYRRLFREHISSSNAAIKQMRELKQLAERQDVFLVCLEKDATYCHRTLVKEMIQNLVD